jgi:hypothetical protein
MPEQLLSSDPKAGLLSTDPNAADKLTLGAHPEAKIGASPVDAPLTLGDFFDNPEEAGKRFLSKVGKEVTDPKTIATLVLGLVAPKAIDAVMPSVKGGIGIVKDAGVGPDLAKAAVGYRAGKMINVAQRINAALKARAQEQPPSQPEVPAGVETAQQQLARMMASSQNSRVQEEPSAAPPQITAVAAETQPSEAQMAVMLREQAAKELMDRFNLPSPEKARNTMTAGIRKIMSVDTVDKLAKQNGKTYGEAKQYFENQGYTIVR